MLNQIFSSILMTDAATGAITIQSMLLCTICSLVLGFAVAWIHIVRNTFTKSFIITLAVLPAIVQMVIMLVNGNLGTGVAVMGAFSLVRFRSVPGSAKEIGSIFLAMAVGLATGTGYLAVAAVFVLIIGAVDILYTISNFGEQSSTQKKLKITIPESLDYSEVFDDIFQKYMKKWDLSEVKTSNMGSLYKLDYIVVLKKGVKEKELIDELRCRNGNLEISCGRISTGVNEL
ncbi:MAG: DUF4956 domain-containing protein [Candidatus Fimimorpha sp.]